MVVCCRLACSHFAILLLLSGEEDQPDAEEPAAAANAGLQLAPIVGAQAKSGACLLRAHSRAGAPHCFPSAAPPANPFLHAAGAIQQYASAGMPTDVSC